MNVFISIIKRVVSIFIIIIFITTAYFFLFLKGDKEKLPSFLPFIDKTTSMTSEISSEKEINELQQHLSELKKISIDADFFDSPVFKSLTNFKKPLPELQQGRENPFAPIGE